VVVSLVGELLVEAVVWVGGEKLFRKLGWWSDTKHAEARFDSKTGKQIHDE